MATASEIDGPSLGILQELQLHPRITNKEIADRIGLSEVTVAARIRAMEERKLLRVMMQRDFRAMGFTVLALVDIRVEGRRPEDVAEELARIDEMASVSVTMSNPEIVLNISARDGLHLQAIIEEQISPIRGIASYEIMTALDVIKLDARFGVLDAPR